MSPLLQILADFRPMGFKFHAVIVFGLGKNLSIKSILGHCATFHCLNKFSGGLKMFSASNFRSFSLSLEQF